MYRVIQSSLGEGKKRVEFRAWEGDREREFNGRAAPSYSVSFFFPSPSPLLSED